MELLGIEMKVEIIENTSDVPQFEAYNVFQTKEWMWIFEEEVDINVVFFAVYNNSQILMLQPITIHQYVKWLPRRFGSYAVAWREPWMDNNLTKEDAIVIFDLLDHEIYKYCSNKTLYIEYRHCKQRNFFKNFRQKSWYNIYNIIENGEDVICKMHKSKKRQLKMSILSGVQIEINPTDDQIREWYILLQKLYRRIHRPLPSVNVFLRLNRSNIGKVFVILYRERVISGSAILYLLKKDVQYFYDWYRASVNDDIPNIYPSVVSTWSALQLVADMGGGLFDFMGAGAPDKKYGVRDFKLKFGGDLIHEYRYRKINCRIL